jgi:uncharacterized membrane protein YhaH (DUF805 family)
MRFPGPPDLYGVIMVLCIWVQFMNNIKRYHDIQRSAWRLLLALIPVLGAIWVFYELAFLPTAPAPGVPSQSPSESAA